MWLLLFCSLTRMAAAKCWKGAVSQEAGIKKKKNQQTKTTQKTTHPVAGDRVLSSPFCKNPTCPPPSEQTWDECLQRYQLYGGCSNKSAANSIHRQGGASAQEDKLRDIPPPPISSSPFAGRTRASPPLLLWDIHPQ